MSVPEADLRSLVVLALVAERPRHAYEVEQCIEERRLREWTPIGFSSVYTALGRLEELGLAASSEAPGEPGRPARRVYRPTEEGRRVLAERTRSLLRKPSPQSSPVTLALLLSMSALAPAEVADALEELAETAAAQVKALQDRREAVPEAWRSPLQDALFAHDLAQLETERTWAIETAARLRG